MIGYAQYPFSYSNISIVDLSPLSIVPINILSELGQSAYQSVVFSIGKSSVVLPKL